MEEITSAAPVAANADAGQAADTKAGAPDAASTQPAPKAGEPGQAPSEPTTQPAFDVQKSYDELRKQFTKVTQDYSKDRKTWNQTLNELQTLKQSQTKIAELLSRVTEQPIDPAQFLQDLQTHGPKAMDGYVNKRIQAETEKLQSQYVEQANKALLLEEKLEKMSRRMDKTNYPDFEQLEPIMAEIADPSNEDCPIDFNQPVGVIYDALYKLARSRSSETAVLAANEAGRREAEATIRKEAASAVPGGGKGVSTTPDLKGMSAAQLRQHFINLGMVDDA